MMEPRILRVSIISFVQNVTQAKNSIRGNGWKSPIQFHGCKTGRPESNPMHPDDPNMPLHVFFLAKNNWLH
jgi:hypothetical protein